MTSVDVAEGRRLCEAACNDGIGMDPVVVDELGHWAYENLPALLTAHEAALGRVREAISDAFKDAFNEHGAQGYGRDTPCQHKITGILGALEDRINAAFLGNRS